MCRNEKFMIHLLLSTFLLVAESMLLRGEHYQHPSPIIPSYEQMPFYRY